LKTGYTNQPHLGFQLGMIYIVQDTLGSPY